MQREGEMRMNEMIESSTFISAMYEEGERVRMKV
jgi:hypothetical protein